MISRNTVAYCAAYYGISPLYVESWTTFQINEWYTEAVGLENEKAKAFNKGLEGGK